MPGKVEGALHGGMVFYRENEYSKKLSFHQISKVNLVQTSILSILPMSVMMNQSDKGVQH